MDCDPILSVGAKKRSILASRAYGVRVVRSKSSSISALLMVAVLGMLFSGIFSPARADDEPPPPLSPPNVVLIKTDDQVWDSMDRLVQYMPNLAGGVRWSV